MPGWPLSHLCKPQLHEAGTITHSKKRELRGAVRLSEDVTVVKWRDRDLTFRPSGIAGGLMSFRAEELPAHICNGAVDGEGSTHQVPALCRALFIFLLSPFCAKRDNGRHRQI